MATPGVIFYAQDALRSSVRPKAGWSTTEFPTRAGQSPRDESNAALGERVLAACRERGWPPRQKRSSRYIRALYFYTPATTHRQPIDVRLCNLYAECAIDVLKPESDVLIANWYFFIVTMYYSVNT